VDDPIATSDRVNGGVNGGVDAGIDAGSFAAWRDAIVAALETPGGGSVGVPCGECTACCRSSMFIHIAPDEVDALRHIPRQLLFPAPGAPAGHVVMGYDQDGCCPMLGERGCTIYDHRPRTCRSFDCRVFAATAVDAGDDKPLLAARVARWRFRDDDEADERARRSVADAVSRLQAEGLDGVRLALAAIEASVTN